MTPPHEPRGARALADRSGRTAPAPNTTGPVRARENGSPGYQRALAQLQAARTRVPAHPLAAPAIESKVRALARTAHAPATTS